MFRERYCRKNLQDNILVSFLSLLTSLYTEIDLYQIGADKVFMNQLVNGVTLMPYKVDVELRDGAVCMMAKNAFNIFLSLDRVAKFKRSEGWIVVGKDQLRDLEKIDDYPPFADRRASK